MSGLPVLPRAQKYQLTCCKCEGKILVKGTTRMYEPEGEVTWGPNEVAIEYECQRLTCKTVNYLVMRHEIDGSFLQWRSYKHSNVKTVVNA